MDNIAISKPLPTNSLIVPVLMALWNLILSEWNASKLSDGNELCGVGLTAAACSGTHNVNLRWRKSTRPGRRWRVTFAGQSFVMDTCPVLPQLLLLFPQLLYQGHWYLNYTACCWASQRRSKNYIGRISKIICIDSPFAPQAGPDFSSTQSETPHPSQGWPHVVRLRAGPEWANGDARWSYLSSECPRKSTPPLSWAASK